MYRQNVKTTSRKKEYMSKVLVLIQVSIPETGSSGGWNTRLDQSVCKRYKDLTHWQGPW